MNLYDKYYLKAERGGIWLERYAPIERTPEELKRYADALQHLAETQSTLVFDTKDYDKMDDVPYGGSPQHAYEYLGVKDWQEFQSRVVTPLRINNDHLEVKFCCSDSEKGEDGCTIYLRNKCRNCKCELAFFFKPNTKFPTETPHKQNDDLSALFDNLKMCMQQQIEIIDRINTTIQKR